MDALYPIRVVAAKTGLSAHLIRMWERRYGAVEPSRTNTRRRLYSESDVRRLTLLRRATQAGAAIGQIATLPEDDLESLVASYEQLGAVRGAGAPGPPAPGYFVRLALEAVADLDARRLESVLLQASVALGRIVLLQEVVMPLLDRVGTEWSGGRLKIAHEHLASSTLRSFLGHLAETAAAEQDAPLLLTTTPAGQVHEFGALVSTVAAASVGWRTAFLGPNLPAEDIAGAARQTSARAVALSIIYPPDDARLADELRTLRRLLDPAVRIIVGGRSKDGYRRTLAEIGALAVDNLPGLIEGLDSLRAASPSDGER
ncbi:MAG TPA: MerR family transcriptional regulator [candidate division Zixibacteria bacterium]|nr:MerR family transcriptional regulator [candidate division Zixibacteria bacterium]HOE28039.1 MerR family transcriptional regulator [bacterium]MDD4916217.1 MerR family transcriptional regulator [candidate division Zixibacteria bacterium]MDM7972737.1 MerR family transcriptional regulator [candidate division Zixibacteria bacterium]HPI32590.1 MerR family transcriptional regulator [candidate division Zixibacteria bacterium]